MAGGESFLVGGEALRRTLKQLRSLQLATPLQMEVVERLLDGRRNLPELVELIFHESSGDPEYKSHYIRVKRAADHLQSQGLVSTKLFGKNKPYRLTRYAVEMLTPIAGDPVRHRLLPRHDIPIYIVTMVLLATTILSSQNEVVAPLIVLTMGWACCVLIGVSLTRFIEMVRRVF